MSETLIFVDSKSIATLGVAAMCVVAFANTMRMVFDVRGVTAAFGASLILASLRLVTIWPDVSHELAAEAVLSIFNACILFCTATGVNEFGQKYSRRRRRGMLPSGDDASGTKFVDSWLL